MSKKKDKKRRYGNAREVAEKRSSGANYGYIKIPKDVKMFTPEPETVAVLDILPYEVTDENHMDKIEPGTLWYKKPFKVHKNVGPSDDSYICPTTYNKACPICDHGEELRRDEDADDKAIEKTRAKFRNLYVVKVRDYDGKKKFDKKVFHLFDFSDFLFQEVFETQLKKKEGFDSFFLPDEGMSLEITFDEGSFGGHKFPKVTRVDFVDRKKQYDEDIVDEVPNLDEDVLNLLSYDELEAKFFGDDVSVSKSEETEEEKPKKKDKKKKKKEKEAEPEEAEEVTKKDKKKKKKDKKKDDELECPYDHKFGKDCDKFDDCADCELWNECKAEKKRLKKEKKKKKNKE